MTATLTVPQTGQAERGVTTSQVQWFVRDLDAGQVVSIWQTEPMSDDQAARLRAGLIRQCTVRVDLSPDQVVTALGLSGHAITSTTDLAAVAAAVLAGCDRAGTDEVTATTCATRDVMSGAPMIRPERDRYARAWPTPARYDHCRAAVTRLITTR